jgi:hypothetical protein
VARGVGGGHVAPEPDVSWVPAEEAEARSLWQRLRAACLLAVMLTVLGAIAALVIVVAGAVILSGLRTAVQ